MDTLFSVLLFLGAINSPGTYTTAEINNLTIVYQLPIQTVESNPILFEAVIEEFYTRAQIVILDDTVG